MLREKLQADQIAALKASEKFKLDTLRYLISAIKNKEIEKKAELNDAEVIAVIRKNVKELHESITAFKKGNRVDLAAECEKQLAIVTVYLPPEMSDQDLKKEVAAVMAKNQAAAQANPKAIIGICVKALRDKAEPARIIAVLQSLQAKP